MSDSNLILSILLDKTKLTFDQLMDLALDTISSRQFAIALDDLLRLCWVVYDDANILSMHSDIRCNIKSGILKLT